MVRHTIRVFCDNWYDDKGWQWIVRVTDADDYGDVLTTKDAKARNDYYSRYYELSVSWRSLRFRLLLVTIFEEAVSWTIFSIFLNQPVRKGLNNVERREIPLSGEIDIQVFRDAACRIGGIIHIYRAEQNSFCLWTSEIPVIGRQTGCCSREVLGIGRDNITIHAGCSERLHGR